MWRAIVLVCSVIFSSGTSWATDVPIPSKSKWFTDSHEIFLPPQLRNMAANYRDFPIFWWNFIVVEGPVQSEDLEKLCSNLANSQSASIQKLPCHFDLKNLRGLIADWAADTPKRQPLLQERDLREPMQQTLAKAALPMGRDVLEILRLDPLGSAEKLRQKFEKRMRLGLDLRRGVLFDPKTKRTLVPIQFQFPPSDSHHTESFLQSVQPLCKDLQGCERLDLFGPHGSTLENEGRIRADVVVVSAIGMVALGILLGFLILTKRFKLLNLVPLLFFSIGVSILATIAVFGSIHGITLGFGPGIVGLSMDYGIHSAFLGPSSRKTWRANLVGLLTTVIVMIILGFSSIPLLRQMMFFASFGLCFNYLVFYLVLPRWPHWFETKFYDLSQRKWKSLTFVAIVMLAGSVLIFTRPVQLSIQHLNFETSRTKQIREWFFGLTGDTSPFIAIENQDDPLQSSSERLQWAESKGIRYEGIAELLPNQKLQASNLLGWQKLFCGDANFQWSTTESRFFSPFVDQLVCDKLQVNDLRTEVPTYLRDFNHGRNFIGLFFATDDQSRTALREKYPQAVTPRDIFSSFPKILYGELLWMLPLSLLASFGFLWNHYRNVGWSLLATVPFLTGVGLFAIVATLFNLPLSFISLIALVMVFGCSLDYGIFILDFLLFRKHEQLSGVWTALSLCAAATITGFAPLIFAKHPVLNDLGHPLFWGTIGTLVGSLWGIPAVHAVTLKFKARPR